MSNLTPDPPSTTLTIDRPSRGLERLDLDGLTFLFQDLEVKERRGDCERSPGETPVPRWLFLCALVVLQLLWYK